MKTPDSATTNARLDFYSCLYKLLSAPEFDEDLARNVQSVQGLNEKLLSAEEFSIRDLRKIHQDIHQHGSARDKKSGDLLQAFFKDMSAQMRSGEVRSLFWKYKILLDLGHEQFVHVRKVKPWGTRAAQLTVVVSNWREFQVFHGETMPIDLDGVRRSRYMPPKHTRSIHFTQSAIQTKPNTD